jgi:hypothetical protein
MNKNSILVAFLIAFITILLGALGFMFYQNNNNKVIIATQEIKIQQTTIRQDSLSIALEQEIEKLNILRSKYEELDEQNDEINLLIQRLTIEKNDWANRANLSKQQIITLENQLKRTILEYDLKRLSMLNEIDSLKIVSYNLSKTNKNLTNSFDSLKSIATQQTLVNQGVIKKAGKLKAENLSINISNKNGKEVSKSPYKESNIHTVSAVFNLSKNDLATKGKRTIVMRIEKPDGGILYDASANGNTFTTSADQQFYYTVSTDVNFNNNFEEVKLTYSKTSQMLEGTYQVQLFINGEDLASTSFEVK